VALGEGGLLHGGTHGRAAVALVLVGDFVYDVKGAPDEANIDVHEAFGALPQGCAMAL